MSKLKEILNSQAALAGVKDKLQEIIDLAYECNYKPRMAQEAFDKSTTHGVTDQWRWLEERGLDLSLLDAEDAISGLREIRSELLKVDTGNNSELTKMAIYAKQLITKYLFMQHDKMIAAENRRDAEFSEHADNYRNIDGLEYLQNQIADRDMTAWQSGDFLVKYIEDNIDSWDWKKLTSMGILVDKRHKLDLAFRDGDRSANVKRFRLPFPHWVASKLMLEDRIQQMAYTKGMKARAEKSLTKFAEMFEDYGIGLQLGEPDKDWYENKVSYNENVDPDAKFNGNIGIKNMEHFCDVMAKAYRRAYWDNTKVMDSVPLEIERMALKYEVHDLPTGAENAGLTEAIIAIYRCESRKEAAKLLGISDRTMTRRVRAIKDTIDHRKMMGKISTEEYNMVKNVLDNEVSPE